MALFVLKAFAIAGLAYSLLVLFESRMSPQLNSWIYGFFPHSWRQHIRGGAYRPIVFLEHGLRVGIFLSLSTLSVAALYRSEPDRKKRLKWLLAVPYLLIVLVMSRNTGALALTVMTLPIILLTRPRFQIAVAAAFAAIVLVYPMARGVGLIPTEGIVAQFEKIDAYRAGSLAYRLENEDILLDRASEKPLFGWGISGRNRVFDRETGESLSVTDGVWIIMIGIRGWCGYLALFGLLCLPPILLFLRRRDQITPVDAGLSLMLVVNLIDLIPNSSLVVHLWLLAGALWGRLGWSLVKNRSQERGGSREPRRAQLGRDAARTRADA